MEYEKLISVTGLPGLYELINTKTDGAIVRSLEDGSSRFASTRQHQFSHLESIEVYTIRENVNLVEIFKAMQASGENLPDEKDAKALKSYFEKTYPDLDFEKVYTSDLKKMVKWYKSITEKGIEIKLNEVPDEEAVDQAEAPPVIAKEEVVEEPKPAKKAAKPNAEKKEEDITDESPKKKTAKKKKED